MAGPLTVRESETRKIYMDAPFGVAQEKRMVIPLPKMKPGIL